MSATTLGVIGDLQEPFLTFKKNRFFEIFSIFPRFLAGRVGLQNFSFWPAEPPKVDETCPTQHFSASWASGEYVRSLVGHHRGGSQPLIPRFPEKSRPSPTVTFWRPCHPVWAGFGNSTGAREVFLLAHRFCPIKGYLSQKFERKLTGFDLSSEKNVVGGGDVFCCLPLAVKRPHCSPRRCSP